MGQQLLSHPYSCSHAALDMKREETVWHRISGSCRWSPLFTERWDCCLSIWRNVWHSRESPQVVGKFGQSQIVPLSLRHPPFTCFFFFNLFFITRRIHDLTPWTPAHSGVTHAHTCQCIDLSISLHLVCGNEEVGATEMISLKIPMSSGRVPGFSVTRFMVKSSKNSAKTLRTLL